MTSAAVGVDERPRSQAPCARALLRKPYIHTPSPSESLAALPRPGPGPPLLAAGHAVCGAGAPGQPAAATRRAPAAAAPRARPLGRLPGRPGCRSRRGGRGGRGQPALVPQPLCHAAGGGGGQPAGRHDSARGLARSAPCSKQHFMCLGRAVAVAGSMHRCALEGPGLLPPAPPLLHPFLTLTSQPNPAPFHRRAPPGGGPRGGATPRTHFGRRRQGGRVRAGGGAGHRGAAGL